MNSTGEKKIPYSDSRPSLKQRIIYFLAGILARLLYATWRIEVDDRASLLAGGSAWPVIFVCWHNRLLFMPLFFPRSLRKNTAGLASMSRDGEYATGFLKGYGMKIVRGSTSRGGYRALAKLKKILDDGEAVAITPDGPRGPRYHVQSGPVIISFKSGCPVIPISINAKKRWELNGWDRTQIPKPFSKVQLVIGEPITFAGDSRTSQPDWENYSRQLEQELKAITADFIHPSPSD